MHWWEDLITYFSTVVPLKLCYWNSCECGQERKIRLLYEGFDNLSSLHYLVTSVFMMNSRLVSPSPYRAIVSRDYGRWSRSNSSSFPVIMSPFNCRMCAAIFWTYPYSLQFSSCRFFHFLYFIRLYILLILTFVFLFSPSDLASNICLCFLS